MVDVEAKSGVILWRVRPVLGFVLLAGVESLKIHRYVSCLVREGSFILGYAKSSMFVLYQWKAVLENHIDVPVLWEGGGKRGGLVCELCIC